MGNWPASPLCANLNALAIQYAISDPDGYEESVPSDEPLEAWSAGIVIWLYVLPME
jgi:hypothetical protein